jgi:hypothetical protein
MTAIKPADLWPDEDVVWSGFPAAEIERFWQTSGDGGMRSRWDITADFIRKRLGVWSAGGEVDAFLGIPDVRGVRETLDRVLTLPRPPAS